MEATEECDDSSEKNEDVMFFNKLIVNINQISLDIAKTISCKFKFNCSLFSSESSRDRSSKSFQLNPEQAADYKVNTEGYTEYSNMMEHSELKNILHSHPLNVGIYDGENLLGTCKINLNVVFGPHAKELFYGGLKCEQEGYILDKDDKMIGSIEYLIVLEQERCSQCQGCQEYFKPKSIIIHLSRHKLCKLAYSKEDMDELKNELSARKKKLRNKRLWRNYDPVKRSQLHAKYYKPVKSPEKYDEKWMEEYRMKKKKRYTQTLMAVRKEREKDVRKNNLDEMKNKRAYFKFAKKILCLENLYLPEDTLNNIEGFQTQIKELYLKLERKIDETDKLIDGIKFNGKVDKCSQDIELIWNKMSDKVMRDWYKLGAKMDHAFKDVAKDHGVSEEGIEIKFDSISSLV